jgi:hypothetical protein
MGQERFRGRSDGENAGINAGETRSFRVNRGANFRTDQHVHKLKVSEQESRFVPKKSVFWACAGYDEYK